MLKVFIETLGCKVNQYESSAIMDKLLSLDFLQADTLSDADIYILNSCTVTNRTDFKSRNIIRKFLELKQQNPNRLIIITGCYAQREKDQILALGAVDAVIDNNHKDKIPDMIKHLLNNQHNDFEAFIPFHEMESFDSFTELPSLSMNEKSRAFIKIQDGCNFFCAYCAVPFARGNPRSRNPESILQQITEMIALGYKEFVLAGINMGLYGIDFTEKNPIANNLAELIQKICEIPAYKKIRISSVEPQLFSSDLIHVITHQEQVCPHFHIPLQTGSDTLLLSMGRKYDTQFFKNLIQDIQSKRPESAFGFDLIVGLPGETDALFEETYHILSEIDFTYLHTFIYSKRNGTRAAKMKQQVHGTVAKDRSQKLINLSHEKLKRYIKHLINNETILSCIIEGQDPEGYYYGTSDHYVKVKFKEPQSLLHKGDLVALKPIAIDHNECIALFVNVIEKGAYDQN